MLSLIDPARFAKDVDRHARQAAELARIKRSWARNEAALTILRRMHAEATAGQHDDVFGWAEIYGAIRMLSADETRGIVRAFAGDDVEPSGWACEAADQIEARFLAIQAAIQAASE